MQGGYQIIDLKDAKLSLLDSQAPTIPGVYDALEHAYGYRDAILLTGINNDGVLCPDRFVVFGLKQGKFISQISIDGDVNLLKLTVDQDDKVHLEMN